MSPLLVTASRGIHHTCPDQLAVVQAIRSFQSQSKIAFQEGRMFLPMSETEIEHGFSFVGREHRRPGRVRVIRKGIIQKRDEFPAGIVFPERFRDFRHVVLMQILPGSGDRIARRLDSELEPLRKTVREVKRHIRARLASREPRETAIGVLRLFQLVEGVLARGSRDR